jgi:hypothetical protein
MTGFKRKPGPAVSHVASVRSGAHAASDLIGVDVEVEYPPVAVGKILDREALTDRHIGVLEQSAAFSERLPACRV